MERPRALPSNLEPLTYTADELGRLMHCTIQHIRNMDGQGRIPGRIKFGRLVRYSKRQVDDWINSCRSQQAGLSEEL
jgi:hypothetical protein